MVEIILATDLADHFSTVSDAKVKFDLTNPPSADKLMQPEGGIHLIPYDEKNAPLYSKKMDDAKTEDKMSLLLCKIIVKVLILVTQLEAMRPTWSGLDVLAKSSGVKVTG